MRLNNPKLQKVLNSKIILKVTIPLLGAFLPILIWLIAKYLFGISDRYLPDPIDVLLVFFNEKVDISYHFGVSLIRILIAFIISAILSLYVGIFLFRNTKLRNLFMPSLQSLRAIPAVATVPFFILWFGFSEFGKIFLFILGISLNLIISVIQVLDNIDEKYLVAFRGFSMEIKNLSPKILTPFALEKMLPTMRFSLTVLIGLSVIAELLGAQSGLGYLIQSARTTYSFDVVVACSILYGFITVCLDYTLRTIWYFLVPWRRSNYDF